MDENFRYKTNNYSLHFILRQIDSGRMEVNPDFKDVKPWSIREKSRFVESLMLGIPTQPIWCEETASGDYIVIEGSERITALVDFVRGKYSLADLKIRKDYTGNNFSLLPYHEKLTLEDRYTFTFIVINYDTSPQLKCEFFRRLLADTGNSGSQSARNFAWPNSFRLLQLIKKQCDPLIDFAPRNSRWGMHNMRTAKSSNLIEEVYLYLLMALTILRGEVFENAYLDTTMSIDELLDWTMSYFDDKENRYTIEIKSIEWSLSRINEYFNHAPRVTLSNSLVIHSGNDHNLTIPKLYLLFIRALSENLSQPIDWNKEKPLRLVSSASARNLITLIFQLRND
jgi:hypothetical protein